MVLLENNNLDINNLNTDNLNYMTELTEEQTKDIIKNHCTNFNKDILLIRGDKSIKNDFTLMNSHKRKIDWLRNHHKIKFHLKFMNDDSWGHDNPVKVRSLDFFYGKSNYDLYGKTKVLIPFGNPKMVYSNSMVGNKNIKLDKLISNFTNYDYHFGTVFQINELLGVLYYEQLNKNTTTNNIDDVIQDLNNFFNNYNNIDIIKNNKYGKYNELIPLFEYIKEHNTSFIDMMEYFFSPDSYKIINYSDINTLDLRSNDINIGWVSGLSLMIDKGWVIDNL